MLILGTSSATIKFTAKIIFYVVKTSTSLIYLTIKLVGDEIQNRLTTPPKIIQQPTFTIIKEHYVSKNKYISYPEPQEIEDVGNMNNDYDDYGDSDEELEYQIPEINAPKRVLISEDKLQDIINKSNEISIVSDDAIAGFIYESAKKLEESGMLKDKAPNEKIQEFLISTNSKWKDNSLNSQHAIQKLEQSNSLHASNLRNKDELLNSWMKKRVE